MNQSSILSTIRRYAPATAMIAIVLLCAATVSAVGADPFDTVGQKVTETKSKIKPILETLAYIFMAVGVLMAIYGMFVKENRGVVVSGIVSLVVAGIGLGLIEAFLS